MTDKIWRLYCRDCGWKGEENAAMVPFCPECKVRLRIETPPYDLSREETEKHFKECWNIDINAYGNYPCE